MIETERLILRRFKEEDYNDLFEYLHEPQVNCFMSMKLNTMVGFAVQSIHDNKPSMVVSIGIGTSMLQLKIL